MTQTKAPLIYRPVTIILCLALLILLEVVLMFVAPQTLEYMLRENGPIENLSALGYLIGFAWLCIRAFRTANPTSFWSGLILLCLALRELDFHDRFTTMGIFKSRYYLSGAVPLPEKLIVTAIVLTLLIGMFLYTRKHYAHFLAACKERQTWALSIATAIFLAILTKSFDRLNEELSEFIFALSGISTEKLFKISEEVLELGIPILLLLAIASISRPQEIAKE